MKQPGRIGEAMIARERTKKIIDGEKASSKWYQPFAKKRTFILLLIPISMLLLWLVKQNSYIGEYVFARGIYIPISKVISVVTGVFPFSIMELIVILLPIVLVSSVLAFLLQLIKKIKNKHNIRYFISVSLLNVVCILSCIYFFYTLVCGVNYHRYSFAQIAGLEIEDSSEQDLYNLTLSLAEEAGELRANIAQIEGALDENGLVVVNKMGWEEVARTAEESYQKIATTYTELGGSYSSLKTVYFSEFMSRMKITGIFWPFTMEANVNIDVPEYSVPVTMCHELAHLRGFMREDEANFIAYLVCKQSDNLVFQYSGVMLALSYAGNQLYRQNQDLYQQVRTIYTAEMNNDIRDEYYYWVKYEDTVISTVSNTMNDNYLKANSQQDGVKSYGRMVDLLLAEYKQNNTE